MFYLFTFIYVQTWLRGLLVQLHTVYGVPGVSLIRVIRAIRVRNSRGLPIEVHHELACLGLAIQLEVRTEGIEVSPRRRREHDEHQG